MDGAEELGSSTTRPRDIVSGVGVVVGGVFGGFDLVIAVYR